MVNSTVMKLSENEINLFPDGSLGPYAFIAKSR